MRWSVAMMLGLVSIALTASTRSADACPCCGPCNKDYRDRERVRLIEEPAPVFEVYVRERAAPMPRRMRRAQVMTLITGARWVPRRPAVRGAQRLRLIDASNVPDVLGRSKRERVALVRKLVLRRGRFELMLDGTWYVVSPCRDEARVTTCLTRVERG